MRRDIERGRGGPVVASVAVGAQWDGASALAGFTERGLAGHLVRAATVTVGYLREPA